MDTDRDRQTQLAFIGLLSSKGKRGIYLTYTTTLMRAVHTKARQALTSLLKVLTLKELKKQSFILTGPGLEPLAVGFTATDSRPSHTHVCRACVKRTAEVTARTDLETLHERHPALGPDVVPAQVQHLQDVVVDCTIAKQKTSKLNGGGKCEEMFTFYMSVDTCYIILRGKSPGEGLVVVVVVVMVVWGVGAGWRAFSK